MFIRPSNWRNTQQRIWQNMGMGIDPQMDDLHTRMIRVTEDLRVIQRELNCAAMQAPSDPELMEALVALPETEAIQTLCKSLDQMRHFLWFYTQVMSNDPELGDKMRQAARQRRWRTGRIPRHFWIS